jgi:FAD/FMN-containing dehydrogenase
VRPQSTAEVSTAVKALAAAGQPFAVRSGGHTNWAGSNNIEGGVTVDLSLLDTTTFDEETETADLAPGARWRQVYAELHKHGRVVVGAREGGVGVAGFLLGGGGSYFCGQRGWACDNVVAYEVVLADGSIVTADEDNHPDLFRALKGGSNNFGIVTNFKMSTIKNDRVWGGMRFHASEKQAELIDALYSFIDNIPQHPESYLCVFFTYSPAVKDIALGTLLCQVDGVENAPAYEKLLQLPDTMNTCKMTSIYALTTEVANPPHFQ